MFKKFRGYLIISILSLHSSLPSFAMDFTIQEEMRSLHHAVSSHKHIGCYGYSNANENSCVTCRPKMERIKVLQKKTDSFMTIATEEAQLRKKLLAVEVRTAEAREREENQRRIDEANQRKDEEQRRLAERVKIKAEQKEINVPPIDVLTTTNPVISQTREVQSVSNIPTPKQTHKVWAPVQPVSNITTQKKTNKVAPVQPVSNITTQKKTNKVAPVQPVSNITTQKKTGKPGKIKTMQRHRH